MKSIDMELAIPAEDHLSEKAPTDVKSKAFARSEYRDLIKQFPPSVKGQILSVDYQLVVYVKHYGN